MTSVGHKWRGVLQLPSVSIFLGMFVGGVGQIVMASSGDRFLNDQDFVSLITWNSFFGIVSLLVGSPLVALVIVHSSDNNSKLDIQEMQSTAISIGLVIAVIASYMWFIGGGKFGHENLIFPIVLLIISPIYQVHAASQRGQLASNAEWLGIAVQLGSEGLFRGGLVLGLGLLGIKSPTLMIFSSWLSTVLSVEITYKFFPIVRSRSIPGGLRKSVFQLFIPLWISSAAIHLILTLTPNLMALKTSDAMAIGAISIGLFVLRIPLTLSSTIFTPFIGPIAKSTSNESALLIFRKTFLFISGVSVAIGVLSFTVGPLAATIISDNPLLSRSSIIGVLGLASGVLLLASAIHTFLLSRKLMKEIAVGWSVTSILFLIAIFCFAASAASVAAIVLISSITAMLLLGIGLVSAVKKNS
jgi:O-antigen/teichoic acid export membrane protein